MMKVAPLLLLIFSALASAQTHLTRPAANVLGISTAGSERLRVTSAGHVGIGTTNPAEMLSVAGSIQSTTGGFVFPDGSIQTTSAFGTGANNSIMSGWPDVISCNNGGDTVLMWHYGVSGGGLHYYENLAGAGNYYITYTSAGNYNGQANNAAADCVTNAWNITQIYANGRGFNLAKGPVGQWLQNGSDAYYNAGKVGIGTSSPAQPLVVTSASTNTTVSASNCASGGWCQNIVSSGTAITDIGANSSGTPIGFVGTNSAHTFVIRSGGGERMYFPTTGNVGVGTSAPAGKLDVAGKVVHDSVEELNWSGGGSSNGTISVTFNHNNSSTFEITAAYTHYGYLNSHGATRKAIVSNGSGTIDIVDIVNVTSANAGAWSFTRNSATSVTISKSAGTYNATGTYFITVRGANGLSK